MIGVQILDALLSGVPADRMLSEAVIFSPGTLFHFRGFPALLQQTAVFECGTVESAIDRVAAGEDVEEVVNELFGSGTGPKQHLIHGVPSTSKPCPRGQIRNRTTGRCVSRDAALCPAGKHRTPSGSCV